MVVTGIFPTKLTQHHYGTEGSRNTVAKLELYIN